MTNRVTVFGLDLEGDIGLPFLRTARAAPTGRSLHLSLVDTDALDWPGGAELISDQPQPDGSVGLQIERSPEAGFRISSPLHGVSILSTDGRRLIAAAGSDGLEPWQRLLIAQVLPFAAVLRGLEVFHASAVVDEKEGIAFLGQSGSGKTSLALELCRRGKGFLADDVVTLERVDGSLMGHPGAPVAGIAQAEADRVPPGSDSCAKILNENPRERVVRFPIVAEPAPLKSLFFLDRSPDGPPAPRFEPIEDPRMLLTATFNFVLVDPDRLQSLLDVCATAARLRVERVVFGPSTNVAELCSAVEQRLSAAK